MTGGLRDDQLERIVTAVETIESSLEVLARKQTMTREATSATERPGTSSNAGS